MNKTIAAIAIVLSPFLAVPGYGQLIVAHRGSSHTAPENTLAAFRLAWQEEADAIEGDFYLTKDGEIVCLHDKNTKRTAPGQTVLDVAKSTLAELRGLDVGSWKDKRYAGEKIPTLHEVLATIPPQKKIFIEVKCGPEITPILKKQLEASNLKSEQITIICFDEKVVQECRNEMPQYQANWLTSYKRTKERGVWSPDAEEVVRRVRKSGATGLGTQGNTEVIDERFVDVLRKAGIELHVWTINDAKEARYFSG
ncbi:MAG: glycerophosphodiester phosphodiesterase, partial [Planctomycetota bacterium]|nr:glycerophosphodiester phosphodiesterase [Planctomycetota bacterium]